MDTLYKHLLIPVDFSDSNQRAIDVALRLSRDGTTQVTLLHVIETIDYVADEEVEQFYKMLTQRAKNRLDEMSAAFRDAKIPVQGKVVMGKRARGIVTFVLNNDVDLVVLSSHRVKLNEAPRGLGTMSHQVSILCPCDVLMVK